MNVDGAGINGSAPAAEHRTGPMKPTMPETFVRAVDAIVESSGLTKIELGVEAGVHPEQLYRASLEWVPLLLFGLAQAAGWTKERLAAGIDRQLGITPRREQGWRSPRVHAQQEAG